MTGGEKRLEQRRLLYREPRHVALYCYENICSEWYSVDHWYMRNKRVVKSTTTLLPRILLNNLKISTYKNIDELKDNNYSLGTYSI